MSSLSDDDLTVLLVRRLQADPLSDKEARQFYDRFVKRLHLYFLRKRVSAAEAEDLTQDVFIRVFGKIGSFRYEHGNSLTAWIFEIARNIYLNRLRSARTQKRSAMELPLEPHDDPATPGTHAPELVDGEPDPLARLTERERNATLNTAMAGLSPQRRRCCYLRYAKRLKYREIAVVMAISIETVKAHLHQARACIVAAAQGTDRSGPGGRSLEDSRSS